MLTRLMVITVVNVLPGKVMINVLTSATKDDEHKTDMISFVYLVIVLSNMYI